MKKIPAAYNQKHTRNELIKALDSLRSQLLVDLRRYFNLYYIDTPLVTNPLPSIYNDRSINFDNLKSGSLYQYLNYPDLAMIKMIHEMEDEHGVFSYFLSINRDCDYTFVKGPYEYKILIEKSILLVEANDDAIRKTASEIVTLINDTIKSKNVPHSIYIPTNIKVVTLTKLKKYYPTISLQDALNEFVRSNEAVLLFDLDDTFEHINKKSIVNFYKNASLYVKSNVNNETIRLMSFNLSPKKAEIIERFKYESNSEAIITLIDNNKTLFSDYNDVLGIEINFTRLMLYVLQKMHVAEILDIPLSKEIAEQFKRNKLSRF